jgi:MinD superfamily P-loop ATPase
MDLVVQVLKELKKPFQVVINKSGNEDALIETYCQKNKIPVLSKIPMDKAIAMTYAGGQLTVSKFPEIQNRFSEMLERIITLQGEKLR